MNLVELDNALRKLRLSGMANVLETRLRQAQTEKMAPIDFVSALVSDELLRRQDLHKPAREMIEFVRLRNMSMQRSGIKLRQQINPAQPGVDAIGNGNVHDPVLARERHRRFGALFGQRK